MHKRCARCEEEKPVEAFSARKTGTSWYSYCKACNNAKVRALDKRRQEADPVANAKRKRAYFIKHYFGLTMAEYEAAYAGFFEKQGGLCGICFKRPGDRALAMDHCHKTGELRGLLCADCNRGIGSFKDRRELLEAAIRYLA